jgi:hypothetical protein
MLTFEESKEILKKFYTEHGFRLVDEGSVELPFASGQSDIVRLNVSEEEIEEYRQVADELTTVRVVPVETSIVGANYREQLVDVGSSGVSLMALRNRPITFENKDGDGTTITIGRPSQVFFNFFRLRKESQAFLHSRLDRPGFRASMRDLFERLVTIKAFVPAGFDARRRDEMTALFESCLFEYAYLRSAPIQLQNEWPSLASGRRRFAPGRASLTREPLPLKRIQYDISAVRFYKRGLGTDDAYIQFISFYHVLEYYFISVSDDILYKRLSRLLVDPEFRLRPRYLDKLILAVEDHKRTNDETEMLKNVMAQYVEEKELTEFILAQEARDKSKIYTEKNECFGEELEKMVIREGHVFGPLAKRIKTIRNTLVHSSDRYERKERYLPGPEADRVLLREVPLLRYVAERVIIATARSLE